MDWPFGLCLADVLPISAGLTCAPESALCLLRRSSRPGCLGLLPAWSPRVQQGARLVHRQHSRGLGAVWEPTDLQGPAPSCMLLLSLTLLVQASHWVRPACRWHSCEERGRGASSSRAFPSLVLCGSWGVVIWLPAAMASVGSPVL